MVDVVNIKVKAESSEVKRASDDLDRFGKSVNKADGINGSFAQSNKRASDALNDTSRSARKASDALSTTGNSSKKASREINNLETSSNKLRDALGGIFSLMTGVGAYAMVKMVDGYKNTNALLKIVTDSTEEFKKTQIELFDVAQSNYQSIDVTTKQYAGQAKQLEEMGRSHADSIEVIDLFGKSLATSGATATESASATLQWTQAISSGVLRGEEFNSIMENGRGVAIALADGLGVTIGSLRAMANDGKLSSKVVVDALLSQGDAIRERFAQIPMTVDKAWTNLTNSVTKKLAQIDEEFGVTSGIANFIKSISVGIDDTSGKFDVANAAVAALGAVAVPVLFMIASALTAATVAATAFAFTPIGAIVVGLTAAVGAVLYLRDEIVTFGGSTASVMDWVLATFDYGKQKIIGWFDTIAGVVASDKMAFAFETLGSFFEAVLVFGKGTINGLINLFVGGRNALVYAWNSLPDAIYNIFARMYNLMPGMVNKIASALVSPINYILKESGKAPIVFDDSLSKMELRSVDASTNIFSAFAGAFKTDHVGDFAISVADSFKEIRGEVGKLAEQRAATRSADKLRDSYLAMNAAAKPIAPTLKKNIVVSKEAKKAADDLAKSKYKLAEGYHAELVALEKERLQIGKNEIQLYRYSLEQERFGKDSLKYSESQIAALVADKKRNIQLKANSAATKALTESTEKLDDAFRKEGVSLEKERMQIGKNELQLYRYGLEQQRFGDNSLRYTKTQIDAFVADKKRNIQLKANSAATKALTESTEKLDDAFRKEGISLEKERMQIGKNELQLYRYGLEQQRFGDNSLRYTKTQIDAFVADKKRNIQLKANSAATKALTESTEKLDDAFRKEGISLEKERMQIGKNELQLYRYGLEQQRFGDNSLRYTKTQIDAFVADKKRNIQLKANSAATKALTESTEKLDDAFRKEGISLEKERMQIGKNELQLYRYGLEQQRFGDNSLRYTKTQIDAFVADKKRNIQLKANSAATKALTESTEKLDDAFRKEGISLEKERMQIGKNELQLYRYGLEQQRFGDNSLRYTKTQIDAFVADKKRNIQLKANSAATKALTESTEKLDDAFRKEGISLEKERMQIGKNELQLYRYGLEQQRFGDNSLRYTKTQIDAFVADKKRNIQLKANSAATKALTESTEKLDDAFRKEGISLEKERMQIGKNELQLYRYGLEQQRFGDNSLRYTKTQIDAFVADKKRNIQLKANSAATKALTESTEKLDDAFRKEGISLEKERMQIGKNELQLYRYGLEQQRFGDNSLRYTKTQIDAFVADKKRNIQLKANSAATKALTESTEKLDDAFRKEGISLEKERMQIGKNELQLYRYGLEQQRFGDNSLRYTKTQIDAFVADKKRNLQLKDNAVGTKKYADRLKELNQKSKYNTILLTQGKAAADLYNKTIEYGNEKRALEITQREKNLKLQTAEIAGIEALEGVVSDLLKGNIDSVSALGDALIDAFDNGRLDDAIDKLSSKITSVLSGGGSDGLGSAVTDIFKPTEGSGAVSSAVQSYNAGASVAGLFGDDEKVEILSGIGSLVGNLIVPGVGGAVGAAVGGAVASALGGKKEQSGSGITLGYSNDGVDGQTYQSFSKEKSLWRGTKRWDEMQDFETESQSALDEYFEGVRATLTSQADYLGYSVDAMKNVKIESGKLSTDGKTDEEIQAMVEEWSVGVQDALYSSVFGDDLEELVEAGESMTDTLVRTATQFDVVDKVAKLLNVNFDRAGVEGLKFSDSLVKMMGGLESFSALTEDYYNNFYTGTERAQMEAAASAANVLAFNQSAGITGDMIDTRDEFRAYVESLDLTTKAGQEAFTQAMQVQDSMSQLVKTGVSLSDVISRTPDDLMQNAYSMLDSTTMTATATESAASSLASFADQLMVFSENASISAALIGGGVNDSSYEDRTDAKENENNAAMLEEMRLLRQQAREDSENLRKAIAQLDENEGSRHESASEQRDNQETLQRQSNQQASDKSRDASRQAVIDERIRRAG